MLLLYKNPGHRIRIFISAHVYAVTQGARISFEVKFRNSLQGAGIDTGRVNCLMEVAVFGIDEERISVDIALAFPAAQDVEKMITGSSYSKK